MDDKPASRRLEVARGLLRLPADADVVARIKAMPAAAREVLRERVDWVMAYEAEEAAMAGARSTKEEQTT